MSDQQQPSPQHAPGFPPTPHAPAPGQGAPAYGAPGEGTRPPAPADPAAGAPGYGAQAPYAPRSTGAMAWALGFLWFVFPIGILAAPVGVGIAAAQLRAKGGLAAENGRRAANWNITAALIAVLAGVLALVCIIVSIGIFSNDPDAPAEEVLAVLGILGPVAVGVPLTILHAVVTIIGCVKASQGKVFGWRFAIPFLKPRPDARA